MTVSANSDVVTYAKAAGAKTAAETGDRIAWVKLSLAFLPLAKRLGRTASRCSATTPRRLPAYTAGLRLVFSVAFFCWLNHLRCLSPFTSQFLLIVPVRPAGMFCVVCRLRVRCCAMFLLSIRRITGKADIYRGSNRLAFAHAG
ncbi:MAG: mandelate racemase/muconate lactonizing protein [Proteobacteria bacterium]|nr:mandelate racemase/muconate lactonizing protein [Pseudomonadota bacterium]